MATIESTPTKSRGRHQHSKSATPSTGPREANGASGNRSQRRPRGNRNHDQSKENTYAPIDQIFTHAAESCQPAGVLNARNYQSTDDTGVSDGLSSAKTKKTRPRQRKANNAEGGPSAGSPRPDNTSDNANRTSQEYAVNTPAKKQMAYAGPTFHASPAASALPVPKFFSKSVPAATKPATMQARLDEDSDKSQSPPANAASAAAGVPREESPLDFFFKADREEKAMKSGGLLTPNSKQDRFESYDTALGGSVRHHSRHLSNGSPRAMFPLELDGNGVPPSKNHPVGNARASIHRSTTDPATQTGPNSETDEVSQKLKNMLHSIPRPATTLPSPPPDRQHIPSEPNSRFQTPSPFYRPNSVPNSAPVIGAAAPLASGKANGSLHYGNRNLSPLFKAAKNDPAKRSSGLRQEFIDHSGISQPNFAPVYNGEHSGQDAAAISRNFLNLHIQSQAAPQFQRNPQTFGVNPGHVTELPANSPASSHSHTSSVQRTPNINHGVQRSTAPNPAQPHHQSFPSSGTSRDVQSMENDLRRILNLNAVGAGVR